MEIIMNGLGGYHPAVNFIYFAAVIGFSMFFMHPACLFIGVFCSLAYSLVLGKKKALALNFTFVLPLAVLSALLNPAFNHEGITILCYLPGGNPLTKESLAYGAAAAAMLAIVINWFFCFNKIMTSDKLVYLFGKMLPSLSLVFSMVLRFVPKFKTQIKTVADAQKGMGRAENNKSIVKKAQNGIKILSTMITWSLENAVDTADSMKSRGYGLPNRTAYSNFKFTARDVRVLIFIAALSVYIFCGGVSGGFYVRFFPSIKINAAAPRTAGLFAAYLVLCIFPVIIDVWEALKWKRLKSKI